PVRAGTRDRAAEDRVDPGRLAAGQQRRAAGGGPGTARPGRAPVAAAARDRPLRRRRTAPRVEHAAPPLRPLLGVADGAPRLPADPRRLLAVGTARAQHGGAPAAAPR